MPIYEYRCTSCGHSFAHLHKRLAEDAPDCPECGASEPRKLLSTFSASVASSTSDSCSLGQCPVGSCCAQERACPRG